jgi:hypothetical protein
MEEKKSIGQRIQEIPYWYHRIELPDGNITPGWAPHNAERYGVPEDLTGKRILDIGAWDGFWTWEALKRGAKEVVAIDDFSDNIGKPDKVEKRNWDSFDICREAFGFGNNPVCIVETSEKATENELAQITQAYKKEYSNPQNANKVIKILPKWKTKNYCLDENSWSNSQGQVCKRIEMNLYDISEETLGRFDVIFFFGTLYHLKNPLLALENLTKICDGAMYVESAICDDYSPYRGGIQHGYANNDMVMEFYPHNQYGNNFSNWWVPTLQCLGSLLVACGYKMVRAWELTDKPQELTTCRGFAFATNHPDLYPPPAWTNEVKEEQKKLKVSCVMAVPRLLFHDNMTCVFEAVVLLRLPLFKCQGAFWGQNVERALMNQIDAGFDAVITIDYDTVFKAEDVKELIRLMTEHPEIDAIVPLHVGRSGKSALLTVKSKTGQVVEVIPRDAFEKETTKIATGHFGLTILRTSSLLKLPHPWFHGQPNADGLWGEGRIDDDISFWKLAEKHGWNVVSANRITVGHMELMVGWPDENLMAIHQSVEDYNKNGKPANSWK